MNVDEAGIRLETLPARQARLLYVTPSHQFPTGAVLSLPRRLELLAWAEKTGTLILEDVRQRVSLLWPADSVIAGIGAA